MRVGVGEGERWSEGYCGLCSLLCREIELPEDDFQEKPEDESVIILDRCKGRGGEGVRCLCVACDRDALVVRICRWSVLCAV